MSATDQRLSQSLWEVADPVPDLVFLRDPVAIAEWLRENCKITGSYEINAAGQVSIHGSLELNEFAQERLQHLHVDFLSCSGTFDCANCEELLTLKGAPKQVGSNFFCNRCYKLQSLYGGPAVVKGSYSCAWCNRLRTLDGIATEIEGDFRCLDCGELRSILALRHVGGICCLPEFPVPVYESVRHLILCRNYVDIRSPWFTDNTSKCEAIVNSYHRGGDLLSAIAQYEDMFKVPFPMAPPVDSKVLPDLPGL